MRNGGIKEGSKDILNEGRKENNEEGMMLRRNEETKEAVEV